MKKYSMETIVGIFVVVGLICVGYLSIRLGKVSLFHQNTYTLYARFTSVEGLRVGSPVEMFGIEAGKVTYLGIDNERQAALVAMSLRKDVKTYRDAMAEVKTMGLIGDKYMKIDPGGAEEPLKPGGTITNTTSLPDIEDLIGQYIFGQVNTQGQAKTPSGGETGRKQ
jgi:phospholipid/cholesterol/gamma-HCH transport system substrate-binding protein